MIAETDVLIVEDNDAVRTQLVTLLIQEGLMVNAAVNGQKALQALQLCRPKVMVTDLYMPEMEGLELIRLTRAMWPDLKIIAMSGGSQLCGSYLPEAARFGADATLQKPFRRSDLTALVNGMLGERRAASAGEACHVASREGAAQPG